MSRVVGAKVGYLQDGKKQWLGISLPSSISPFPWEPLVLALVEGASCFISKILNCHLTAKNRVNEILKKVLSCWTFFSPNITKSEPHGSFLRHLSFCRFNSDYPQLSAYNWQNTLQISTAIHNNGISSLLASFCNGIIFLRLGRLRKRSNSL